ncbi:hypothetical protein [Nocardiopsis sp. MG754419]|uniref:hypothetical protein n=1 Tax=Nocardiopsis sp. MG754419 TaxID=2259865 RepID=UPI001BA467F4|nr:hypothetical protein [Nocardiopsis sp. MG754419]MBR8741109.1 hypothetical protein [Nocardiopsis sp. MG754419]
MRTRTLAASAVATLGLLLTGCGVLAEEGEGAEGEATEKTMEEAMMDFASCMRDHGVDMPDPEPDGGLVALPAVDPEDEEMMAAVEECDALLPVDENAPSDEEVFEDNLRVAECMRENGVDVPDPEPGEGLALTVDPDDEENMRAVQECGEIEFGEPSGEEGES